MVPPKPDFVKTLTAIQWKHATLSERFIHVCRSQDAVAEFPKGSNTGPIVKLYLLACSIFSPAAWCMAFLTWCLLTAGAKRSNLPTFAASTYYWLEWAKKRGRRSPSPRRGNIGVWNDGLNGGHGFAILSDGSSFRTIEGNSNEGGSREGHEVVDRVRSVAEMKRHKSWAIIDVEGLDK